jgi:hypothetical protein
MVDVNMSPTSPKVIGKEIYLRAKGFFGLWKDLGPKRHPNTLWKEESKEIKNFLKVEDGSVHRKKYNGRCMKQQVRIPKATWTSPILRKRSTCRTSFCKVFFMKYDVKVMMFNRTFMTLILSNGVVNWDGVLKSNGRLECDHVMHIAQNLVWKCL